MSTNARADHGHPAVSALAAAGIEIDASSRRRAEYSYDASNYRIPPVAVAFPRTAAQVRAIVDVCREHATPVVPRGGGTGQAGNAIGPGIVVDCSRYLTAIRAIDLEARLADVEPGVVLSHLTDEAARRSGKTLTFAPDPSSRTRATIGGSIANDACGNHSVRYGRMGDHVVEIDVVTADGALVTLGQNGIRATDTADARSRERAAYLDSQLRALAGERMALLRNELGRIPRQVSGYHLEHLLPEKGFDVAKAFAGSEGTLGIIVGARVRLVPAPPSSLLICLGYRDVVDAAADVPRLLTYGPTAIEGIDDAIVTTMRYRRGADSVTALPEGKAWLYVGLAGEDADEVAAQADRLVAEMTRDGHAVDARAVPDPVESALLWRVREDGAGLSSRLAPEVAAGRLEAWTGWEDSAVAPERLADYLRELRELLARYGLASVLYGHFGAGCMHVRITFDLRTPEGIATTERFLVEAAELVVAHGGSLSGEHGDGRARSALLPLMYSPEMMATFADIKRLWDPAGLLNPGSIVDPDPVTDRLALAGIPERDWGTAVPDHRTTLDPFVASVQACIGVGKCRTTSGGVMCPSYRATRDEKNSTRGRARVLQEMTRTAPSVAAGWASADVAESLDLCLSCKACSTDCPTGVDMATFKSEFLHQHYAGRRRPLSHYSLGRLPQWLALAQRTPRLANAAAGMPFSPMGMRAIGLTDQRQLPAIAGRDDWKRAAAAAGATRPGSGTGDALLLVDTFTRGFRPALAGSAAAVLGAAGDRVECTADACCGLTYISTGQLDRARSRLEAAVDTLDDGSDRPIVVVEPSCAATLRTDLPHLIPTDRARTLAQRVRSFAAYVRELGAAGRLAAPAQVPEHVLVQPHCHEYAAFGPTTQTAALQAAGVGEVTVAAGCCGVAGNFGFEAQHYDLSVAVADQALRPALDAADDDIPVLTDGFSCHMQVDHLAPQRRGRHLAELLDPRKDTSG